MKFWAQVLGKTWVILLLAWGPAGATVFHNQQEALALAFPEATRTEPQTYILTAPQAEAIEKAGRSTLPTRLVTIHRGWKGDTFLGYAHIDVHTVRTKPEAFMVVLTPDAVIQQVRVLAFHEPLEYMPDERWYEAFFGQTREADLRVGFDVDAVTGATLTTRATIDSVRRMLAYYDVLLADDGLSRSNDSDTVLQQADGAEEGGG